MPTKPKKIVPAPWTGLTYKIIGQAMQVHNELGPGHREAVYHDAMAVKLEQAGLNLGRAIYPCHTGRWHTSRRQQPRSSCRANCDHRRQSRKARFHLMTKDDQARIISYFAALPECPVALFINFGRPRLEYHRLL